MGEKICSIFTFHSTHFALKMEAACRKENIPGKLIPVPRSISSSCGIAFQGEIEDREQIEEIAHRYGVEYEQVVEYKIAERKSILDKFFTKKDR